MEGTITMKHASIQVRVLLLTIVMVRRFGGIVAKLEEEGAFLHQVVLALALCNQLVASINQLL